MKVIFMGTPAFALPALTALINSENHQVVAVFTQRPKPRGRGMKEDISPVHELALKNNIEVYTPKTLRTSESLELVKSIDADIIVVVAYGFIITPEILKAKKYGCLNIHPSKLPKYRGAAPLQRTIINGESETAICIMQMDEGLDTGDIILEEDIKLSSHITLTKLHDITAEKGGDLLIKVLDNIDKLPRIPQSNEGASYAHKLTKEEGRINWQDSAYQIDCKIRGMTPWPGVYFNYQGKDIKILQAEFEDKEHQNTPGQVINDKLHIACGKGILKLLKLQQPGKKPLLTEEFLRGVRISSGTKL